MEIKYQFELAPFIEEFRKVFYELNGSYPEGPDLMWIYDFACFMATRKGYTYQPATVHIENFAPEAGPDVPPARY
jgi:hypothetical protein